MIRRAASILAALTLSGCATAHDTPPDTCNATAARSLIGKPATARRIERARRMTRATAARVLKPGTMATMEFRTDRLNVRVDEHNRVVDIICG